MAQKYSFIKKFIFAMLFQKMLRSISDIIQSKNSSETTFNEIGAPECVVCLCAADLENYCLETCGHYACRSCLNVQVNCFAINFTSFYLFVILIVKTSSRIQLFSFYGFCLLVLNIIYMNKFLLIFADIRNSTSILGLLFLYKSTVVNCCIFSAAFGG